MKIVRGVLLFAAAFAAAACSPVQGERAQKTVAADNSASLPDPGIMQDAKDAHPEARAYENSDDAMAEVDAALSAAAKKDTKVILAMGANWCHDSRAFAGWMATPRFADMLGKKYEIVYIDVGHPQRGEGRNIDIAQRFGIGEITGTPTVLVLSPEGKLLNADTAATWRNAASRSGDEIFSYFEAFP